MPLPDSLLDKPLNAHRCRPAGETVLAALRDDPTETMHNS